MRTLKSLIAIVVITICAFIYPMNMSAQSSCDRIFSEGVKLQQTMTIAAQNKAIAQFEKAKKCYDSVERRNICDQQIATCRAIIKSLRTSTPSPAVPQQTETVDTIVPAEVTPVDPYANASISVKPNSIKFKSKADFKKVNVTCNYTDWSVTSSPEWVSVSRNKSGELVIEATENTTEDDRSGIIRVACGKAEAILIVNQEKDRNILRNLPFKKRNGK